MPNFVQKNYFIWHGKLFPEFLFFLLQNHRMVDIILRQKKREKKMNKMVRKAKRLARKCFLGIAIPTLKKSADGDWEMCEKVWKFNRISLLSPPTKKANKKQLVNPAADLAFIKVGRPGSKERMESYKKQYEAVETMEENLSLFAE